MSEWAEGAQGSGRRGTGLIGAKDTPADRHPSDERFNCSVFSWGQTGGEGRLPQTFPERNWGRPWQSHESRGRRDLSMQRRPRWPVLFRLRRRGWGCSEKRATAKSKPYSFNTSGHSEALMNGLSNPCPPPGHTVWLQWSPGAAFTQQVSLAMRAELGVNFCVFCFILCAAEPCIKPTSLLSLQLSSRP